MILQKTKKENREIEIKEAKEKLIQLLNETTDKTIYSILRQVSKSGMKRAISFCVVIDNKIIDIDYRISKVLDCYPIDKKYSGLKVVGCGMDMGFAVVYDLKKALYPKDIYNNILTHNWI